MKNDRYSLTTKKNLLQNFERWLETTWISSLTLKSPLYTKLLCLQKKLVGVFAISLRKGLTVSDYVFFLKCGLLGYFWKVSCWSATGIIFKSVIRSYLLSSNQAKYLSLSRGFIEFSDLLSSKHKRHITDCGAVLCHGSPFANRRLQQTMNPTDAF